MRLSPTALIDAICASVDLSLWKKASEHYCGAGLESGMHPSTFTLLKTLRKKSMTR